MSDPIARLNAALEGRYRLQRELGEGGMATVYLADDLRHERKVALKVLKPELAAVVGAERFLAEIKTTANLQHPHILPLFESGAADGFLFYVMPYVDGESLRERLERQKQLPVDEAVGIATGVAEALHAAHEQGVIHRDIKPANILLSRGHPFVADFGIALAVSAAGGGRLTETGLSMGTPHYMSPEQATGDLSIGAASDIYAVACVLYEMLVGEPPYTGGTPQAILGKIIAGELSTAAGQRPSVPANVDAALNKALERVPADRFGSAKAFAAALIDPAYRHGTTTTAGAAPGSGYWRALALGSCCLSAVLAATLAWGAFRSEPPPPVARQLLRAEGWSSRGAALAPDGSSMILPIGIGQERQLALKTRASAEVTPIPGTEGAHDPQYSPDGQSILYVSGTDLVRRPLVGGAPVRLVEDGDPLVAATAWLPDGTIIYEQVIPGTGEQKLVRIPEDGGPPSEVVFGEAEAPVLPQWVIGLPDSRGLLVTACSAVIGCPAENANLYVVDLRRGSSQLVLEQVVRAWYTPTEHIVYLRADGAMFAVPFDLASLELGGTSVPLFGGVRFSGTPQTPDVLLGTDGTLVYVEGDVNPAGADIVWVDRSGREAPVDPNLTRETYTSVALSPDDQRLAIIMSQDGLPSDLWVKSLPDGPMMRLTTDPGATLRPVWSPDGSTIAYITAQPGRHVRTVRSDGASVGAYEVLLELESAVEEVLFVPDGSGLVFRKGIPGIGGADLGLIGMGAGASEEQLFASEFNETQIALSPDGRWLAYTSDVTGRAEIFVRPFGGRGLGLTQVSTNGGREPVRAHNGRELFYRETASGGMMVATYGGDDGFRIQSRERLFDAGPYLSVDGWRGYDVSVDDQRFVMIRFSRSAQGEDARLIQVQNWWTELRERTGGG